MLVLVATVLPLELEASALLRRQLAANEGIDLRTGTSANLYLVAQCRRLRCGLRRAA